MTSPFVDIATLELPRSSRPKKHPMRMSQVDPATKEIHRPASHLGLLILTALALISPAESLSSNIPAQMASCFQYRSIAYDDFFDRSFDGSSNSTNPFAQIYLTSKSDN